jgi:hypothetical protein
VPGHRALQQLALDTMQDLVTHRLPLKVAKQLIDGCGVICRSSQTTQRYGDKLPDGAKDLEIGLPDEHEAA